MRRPWMPLAVLLAALSLGLWGCSQFDNDGGGGDSGAPRIADRDGDGVADASDSFPDDPAASADTDGDGAPDAWNATATAEQLAATPLKVDAFPADPAESLDTDDDGLGNNSDTDDDGDGLADADEGNRGTDPLKADSDDDGISDASDAFPTNRGESRDSDGDGIGNNSDPDDDNDGLSDIQESGAGTNSLSADTDGDGVSDSADAFPTNRNESKDMDGDRIGDNSDPDRDGDGVANAADAFPSNRNESADTDGDGIGDNADPDADGDGVANVVDAFPANPAETADTDGDGQGNNADADDDNDGIPDASDKAPWNAGQFAIFNAPVALDGLSAGPTAASAINDAGHVVGNSEPGAGLAARAVVWDSTAPGAPLELQGLAPGAFSLAHGNNNADQIVGEAANANGDVVAVLWKTAADTPLGLPSIPPFAPLDAQSAAFDVNDSGLIVGQAETAKYEIHPVAWLLNADGSVSGAKDLQVDRNTFAGTPFGRANAVSANGLVVGEMQIPDTARTDAGATRAVVWKLSGLTIVAGPVVLAPLPDDEDTTALSVNEAGVIVGESVTRSGDTSAVRWTVDPATLVVTGPVNMGTDAEVCAVNRSGRIAGSAGLPGGSETATVWDLGALSPMLSDPVNPAAPNSNRAVDLNNLGQVVGIRNSQAFVATPQ